MKGRKKWRWAPGLARVKAILGRIEQVDEDRSKWVQWYRFGLQSDFENNSTSSNGSFWSDLVHVKQEGDTCKPLRGPDHNISVYEGQWTWSWIWVTILWNATSNWIFRLTLVEAQAAGAEWPRLSRPEGFILYAVRNASSFHLEMILLGKGLVQTAAEILQRVFLNNILHVKKTHQRWNNEDVTIKDQLWNDGCH